MSKKSRKNKKSWTNTITGISIGTKILTASLIAVTLISVAVYLNVNIKVKSNINIYIDTNTIYQNKIEKHPNLELNNKFYC